MKQLSTLWLLGLLIMSTATQAASFDQTHAQWTRVLQSHVRQGLVQYAALHSDSGALDAYLETTAAVTRQQFESWHTWDQLAFLINLYNAGTIRLILDEYPIASIQDIGFLPHAAWRRKCVWLWGSKVSLNHIEHDQIRPRSEQVPEIHFALVCAAMGCPPLRSEAYTGTKIKKQLDEQANQFLSTSTKNRLDLQQKRLFLSPLFDWYASDFKNDHPSVTDYLSQRFPERYPKDLSKFEIIYTEYDWALNAQPIQKDKLAPPPQADHK